LCTAFNLDLDVVKNYPLHFSKCISTLVRQRLQKITENQTCKIIA
jgi:hypothetical protein